MSYPYQIIRKAQDVAAAGTDVQVVAAVAGRRIRVIALVVTADTAATTVLFESGATPALTVALDVSPSAPLVLPEFLAGWFQTDAGAALNVTAGAAGISLHVVYAEV